MFHTYNVLCTLVIILCHVTQQINMSSQESGAKDPLERLWWGQFTSSSKYFPGYYTNKACLLFLFFE